MALSQFPSERLRGGFASLGAVYRCGAVYHGWFSDTGSQVHFELVQRLPELLVRGSEVGDTHGRHALCGAAFRDFYKGPEDSSRVYVQRLVFLCWLLKATSMLGPKILLQSLAVIS